MNVYIKKSMIVLMSLMLIVPMLTGCVTNGKSQKTNIEIFVFKPEVIATFQKLIEQFEKENPDIHVQLSTPGNAFSVLKARMVKGNEPDIVGLDGEQYYVDYAKAGVFTDVTNSSLMKQINPVYKEMLANLEQSSGKVHAFPYAANATGIIYNKDEFQRLNLKIPRTWEELKAVCKAIKKKGKTPFYIGYKDDWTIYSAWNPLAGNFTTSYFYHKVTEGETSFERAYKVPLKRLKELDNYSQGDVFSYNYNNATVGFAKGQSVMYMQGNWAIPMIKQTNPNIHLGVFPFPAMDHAKDNKLSSGIDLMFSLSKSSKHKSEAMRFLRFLYKQKNSNYYMKSQFAIPASNDKYVYTSEMKGIAEYFKKGNLVGPPQYYYPSEMKMSILLQTYLLNGNKGALYSQMNKAWKQAHND